MSVPHPGGDPNANLYYQLKRDVLERVPEIDDVEYTPNRAEATSLVATFDPSRLDVEVGPAAPTLEVVWYRQSPDDWFRVDYSDPNVGLHVGWHQDEDHPKLGPVHCQVTTKQDTDYCEAAFDSETPSLLLWEMLDRLLDRHLPRQYE